MNPHLRPQALSSSLYEGTLSHLRLGPGPVHRFERTLALPLVFLDELAALDGSSHFFSTRHAAPLHWQRSDFLRPVDVPLEERVHDVLAEEHHDLQGGRIALLAQVRTFGWLFNPLSVYFAFDSAATVRAAIAEVENTPWHERHAYVVGPPGEHHFEKALHVSPFLPMALSYRFSYTEPSERLKVRLDAFDGEERRFTALFDGTKRPLDAAGFRRLLWRHPLGAQRVSAGIYAQAARLGIKRAPFFAHPKKVTPREPGRYRNHG